MTRSFLATTAFALCIGAVLGGPVLAEDDPCEGFDVHCGLDEQDPESCSVCWPAFEGGHTCATEQKATIKADMPGCVEDQVDPLGRFGYLPPSVRDKLPRDLRRPEVEIARPKVEIPTGREPQVTGELRNPRTPSTAAIAGQR